MSNNETPELYAHAVGCLDVRNYHSSLPWSTTLMIESNDLHLFISCERVFHLELRLRPVGSLQVVWKFKKFNHDSALKRALETAVDYILHDYVATFCNDSQADSPTRLQDLKVAFSMALKVLQEGPARGVALPTEQLCSVLLAPDIFSRITIKCLNWLSALLISTWWLTFCCRLWLKNWRMEKWP